MKNYIKIVFQNLKMEILKKKDYTEEHAKLLKKYLTDML